MTPIRYRGQLIRWQDDRGFGFIKPDDGTKEIFIHISELKRAGRRPSVGDQIIYEQNIGTDGRISAVKASIQGVAPQPANNRQFVNNRQPANNRQGVATRQQMSGAKQRKSGKQGLLVTGIIFPVIATIAWFTARFNIIQPECNVKGNISVSTGNKLYHVPGMEDYESTVINPSQGEKWFCSEAEAREAGWHKAPK